MVLGAGGRRKRQSLLKADLIPIRDDDPSLEMDLTKPAPKRLFNFMKLLLIDS